MFSGYVHRLTSWSQQKPLLIYRPSLQIKVTGHEWGVVPFPESLAVFHVSTRHMFGHCRHCHSPLVSYTVSP